MNLQEIILYIIGTATTGLIGMMVWLVKTIHNIDKLLALDQNKISDIQNTENIINKRLTELPCNYCSKMITEHNKDLENVKTQIYSVINEINNIKERFQEFDENRLITTKYFAEIQSDIKNINNNIIDIKDKIKEELDYLYKELSIIKDDVNKMKY